MFNFFNKETAQNELRKKQEVEAKLKKKRAEGDNEENDEDDDERFIGLNEAQLEDFQEEVEGVIDTLEHSDSILPESHHQRNLDRELGGLEVEKDKGISEKDIWDDRSEEVDRMGSVDPYGTSGKKSMLWKLKKKRLDEKKDMKEQAAESAQEAAKAKAVKKNSGTEFDSRITAQTDLSYTARLRQMQQDRSGSQGGGMSR